MSYDVLAAFYDSLNSTISYGEWMSGISKFLDNHGIKKNSKILDIACGTGKMTLEAARLGYSVLGVDLSSEMLSVAQKSCADEGFYPTFVCQDMTVLDLCESFDSAICCLDSVNYIKSKEELNAFFARAAEHINEGGFLFFDVNTEYKFKNIYGTNSYIYDEKDVFCVWQNFYSNRRRLCDFELTFFVKNENGTYSRLCETQREYLYDDKELSELLEQNGFEVVYFGASYDFSSGKGSISSDDERHYFIAKRKNFHK